MRRQVTAAVTAAFVMVVVAGCGTPAGTDGDLSDDWRPMAQAQQFAPEAGECHVIADPTAYLTSYAPVDCAKTHLVETFHVGTFTGALAARTTPPPVESATMRSTFADCDTRAKQFVGGDWRTARLSVQVAPTSPAGWKGGARWYRCDIFELDEVNGPNGESDAAIQRTDSLRGALASRSPLTLGCMNEDKWGMLRTAGCTAGHQFEFVGIWTAPDRSWADAARDEAAIHTACRAVIARYAKVPVDGKLPYRTGTAYRFPSRPLWERGDRGVRCYYWSSGTTVKRSIAGGGTAVLPIR
ncbi:septum formation family protein [Micromonospora sp. STR1_7]|uniref:Septum formation family protein n=1 Tax=Micromonospora parastrephiae TaxID=2806101 RepID=A0ABS1XRF4_9ACTN|nr:septum formation family protein [Micromonospora parastrephiae]MBM0231829.1 septum formation family protein [Micromonospora parastrephiae]